MIYKLILKLRDNAYKKGRKKVEVAQVPTICVGNVTVGGTGKTPHTEMLIRLLQDQPEFQGKNISVLSRGYKRKSRGYQEVAVDGSVKMFGDEPLQIKRKFPDVWVSVDKKRVNGCWRLVADHDSKLIILDDAFQYRRLSATLNIVLVDYNRPVFNDSLLPFGRLRDLPERIFDADIIIVTKCSPYITQEEKVHFSEKLKLAAYQASSGIAFTPSGKEISLFFTTIKYCEPKMVFPDGEHRYTYCKKAVLFSGIAKDGPLRQQLSDNYKVVASLRFPDHHNYTRSDINRIMAASESHPVSSIATTEKDAQRLYHLKFLSDAFRQRLFMIPIEADFTDQAQQDQFLRKVCEAVREEGSLF